MLMKDMFLNSKIKFLSISIYLNIKIFTNNDRLFVVNVDIFEGDCRIES
jgi:hypothetical protein